MGNDLLEIVQNLNRLAALQATRLLDSPPEEPFDRLARIACKVAKAPVALISLVDRDRQFFKSSIGLPDAVREPASAKALEPGRSIHSTSSSPRGETPSYFSRSRRGRFGPASAFTAEARELASTSSGAISGIQPGS